MQKPLR